MAEPVSSAVVSAIVNGVVGQVWGQIMNSEDPEEVWKGSAQTCVVEARASISNYDLKLGENYKQMKRKIGNIGESAQQLTKRGEIEDFSKDLINLLEEFARCCTEYANSLSVNNYDAECKFEKELDGLGSKITDAV